ncbi:MAG: ribosome maturation factor RimM [Endomicrobiia bacterium]
MLLRIGQVLSTKGLCGEIKAVFSYSRFIAKENDILFFEKEENIFGPYKVLYSKHYKIDKNGNNIYIIKLEDVENVTKAKILTKSFIGQDVKTLPENIFIMSDLKKCVLFNINNNIVGNIVDVIQLKRGYSLLVVRKNDGEEIFVPFVKEIIDWIDINNKKVMLKNVDGVLDQ